MANTDKPYGFRPVGTLGQGAYVGKIKKFWVPSGTAGAIFIGDTVKLAATGVAEALYPDDVIRGEVEIGAQGSIVVGVLVGVEPVWTDLSITYRKASTAMYVLVDVDPMTIYSVQGDSGTFTTSMLGLNANITVTGGSTTTGRSASVITTPTADAAKDVLILDVDPDPQNEMGVYTKFLVKLNLHQYASGIVRLGID
jgi:hypothetical protein